MEQLKAIVQLKDIGRTLLIAVPVWSGTFMSIAVCFLVTEVNDDGAIFATGTIVSSTITVLALERFKAPWWYVVLGNVVWFLTLKMFMAILEPRRRGPFGDFLRLLNVQFPHQRLLVIYVDLLLPTAIVGTLLYLGAKKYFKCIES